MLVFDLEIVVEIVVDGGCEGGERGGRAGVILGFFAGVVGIDAFVAAVVSADDSALFAQQLFGESLHADPQFCLQHVVFGQAGVAGQLFGDGVSLILAERLSLHESQRVIVPGEFGGLFHHLFERKRL